MDWSIATRRIHVLAAAGISRLQSPPKAWPAAHPIALPDRPASEHTTLAEVASKHPNTLVCLLSALQFHGLTTQSPFEVWVAIANKARAPKMDYPPLRVVRFSGDALTEGVEKHAVDGVTVQVTSVAKTVADCFKQGGPGDRGPGGRQARCAGRGRSD